MSDEIKWADMLKRSIETGNAIASSDNVVRMPEPAPTRFMKDTSSDNIDLIIQDIIKEENILEEIFGRVNDILEDELMARDITAIEDEWTIPGADDGYDEPQSAEIFYMKDFR